MKKLFSYAVVACGLLFAQQTKAQVNVVVVHNCPSKEADTVDVWVKNALLPGGEVKLLSNLAFRQAYYVSIGAAALPAGTDLVVTPKGSTSTVGSVFTKPVGGLSAGNYTLIATGLVDSSIKVNPNGINKAFDLDVNASLMPVSADPNKFYLAFKHGVVDAPAVTVQSFITTIQSTPRDSVVDNAPFRAHTNFSLYSAAPHRLHVYATGTGTPLIKYNGDILKILGGKAALGFASGFVDTTGTGTKNTIGVYAAVIDTTALTYASGLPISVGFKALTVAALPVEKVAGVVQVYHNSGDPLVKNIDLYVGGIKQIIGLGFRQGFQSAGFIQDFDYNIALHAKDSSASVLTQTLRLGTDSVVAVVAGVVDPSKFTTNPDGVDRSLKLYLNTPTRVTMPAGSTQITVFHGATDAPTVSLTVPAVGGAALISGLKYGQYQVASAPGIGSALPTSLGNVLVDLRIPGGTVYKSYIVPLSAIDGKAVTVCASGFLDTSAANQHGPLFKIFAGIPNSPLPAIAILKDTSIVNSITDPRTSTMQLRMFPNPANTQLVVGFDVAEASDVVVELVDLNGRVVKTIVNEHLDTGTKYYTENLSDLNSGMYFARVRNGKETASYKVNVLH